MPWLEPVRAKDPEPLLLFDQLANRLDRPVLEEKIFKTAPGSYNADPRTSARIPIADMDRHGRVPQRIFESLREKVVLLLPFLSGHRLHSAAQLGLVLLSSRSDESDK